MSRILPITPMMMRGLGPAPALVTVGFGPAITKIIRIIRLSLNIKSNSFKFELINSIHGIRLNNKRTTIKMMFWKYLLKFLAFDIFIR